MFDHCRVEGRPRLTFETPSALPAGVVAARSSCDVVDGSAHAQSTRARAPLDAALASARDAALAGDYLAVVAHVSMARSFAQVCHSLTLDGAR